MLTQLRTAGLLLLAMTIVTGGAYPLLVTAAAQLLFPYQATGSLLQEAGSIRGSALIGQSFSQPEYFWGRLSATSPVPYNAAASGGSNYGPLHPELRRAAAERIARLTSASSGAESARRIPVDLVTASGSGLDPHISPAAAEFQIPRVAQFRGLPEATVRDLVRQHTAGRQLGLFGEARVHVLRLNVALDQIRNAK